MEDEHKPNDTASDEISASSTGEAALSADLAPDLAANLPSNLGTRRFVYAAYLAGALAIAFFLTKVIDSAWLKVAATRPAFGEPRDEIVMPIAAVAGAALAAYYWKRTRTRVLAEEVAVELSRVTWPTREEVFNSTTIVLLATLFATLFFFVMDQLWSYLTQLVFGS